MTSTVTIPGTGTQQPPAAGDGIRRYASVGAFTFETGGRLPDVQLAAGFKGEGADAGVAADAVANCWRLLGSGSGNGHGGSHA